MSQDGVTVEKLADGSQLQSYADGSSLQVSVAPNNQGGAASLAIALSRPPYSYDRHGVGCYSASPMIPAIPL